MSENSRSFLKSRKPIVGAISVMLLSVFLELPSNGIDDSLNSSPLLVNVILLGEAFILFGEVKTQPKGKLAPIIYSPGSSL